MCSITRCLDYFALTDEFTTDFPFFARFPDNLIVTEDFPFFARFPDKF